MRITFHKIVVVFAVALPIIAGCTSGKWQNRPSQPKPVAVKEALRHHSIALEKEKRLKATRYVFIQGTDIELPLTVDSDKPANEHIYTFYVWAHQPQMAGTNSIKDILGNKLRVDVVGAKAEIRPAVYTPSGNAAANTSDPSAGQIGSEVVEVRISSADIAQPFQIIAWFPQEYDQFKNQQEREIRNLKQELETLHQIATATNKPSNEQIEQLDERIRARLQEENPWGQVKAVRVYKGDLRAQVIMASKDEVAHSFGPEFAKYFFVGRVFLRNRLPDKKLIVYTTSLKANTLFYREPDKEMAKLVTGMAQEDRLTLMEGRIGARLARSIGGKTLTGLTAEEVSQVIESTRTSPLNQRPRDIVDSAPIHWNPLNKEAQQAECISIVAQTQDAIRQQLADMAKTIKKQSKSTQDYEALANRVASAIQKFAVLQALKDDPDTEVRQMGDDLQRRLEQIKQGIISSFVGSTPMDFPIGIPVNVNNRNLAFSDDAERQAKLSAHGYIWQDYYRPMTFQSVLNSLIVSTESSTRAQVMKWLETAGVVAGAAVGLGAIFNEVTTKSYVEAVAVTTSIILPEARKILLDDLNKYIKNLGDLGMDTVVEIPPLGVVDRYVFFPRGPIFYGIDEFSVNRPSYIVQIDNVDVAVEASIIEKSQLFESGELASAKLVTAAVNAGKAVRSAEEAKVVAMTDSLRSFRLLSLPQEVDDLMKSTNTLGAVKLIYGFVTVFGQDPSGVIVRIASKHNLDLTMGTNHPPAISSIPNFSLLTNAASSELSLQVKDWETPANALKIESSSSATNIIPLANIVVQGTNEIRTLTITAGTIVGNAEITIQVSDGQVTGKTKFTVEVKGK